MKPKVLLAFVTCLIITSVIDAQSIFHLKYQFNTGNKAIKRQAFLVRFNNGTGFCRVSFYDETAKRNVISELQTEEHFELNKDGIVNTNKLYLKGSNPQIIEGTTIGLYPSEVFSFQKDPQTGIYEPSGVSMTDTNGEVQGVFLENPKLVAEEDLTIDFVSVFFKESDQFYKNTFNEQPDSRGNETKATKLYLIAVANTEAKDIGPSCLKDQKRNIKTFNTLAVFLGIQIIINTVEGTNYSKESVDRVIDSLNPSASDIVVFCYSGHGFTIPKKNKKQKFPNLDLRPMSTGNYLDHNLNIEDIFNRIKKKGARFNLVISDCCNDDPNATNSIGNDIAQTRDGGMRWSMENCSTLFMNEKPMSVLMTSASIGERASGSVQDGGFFSLYFKTAMESHFSKFKTNVTWNDIFNDAKIETIKTAKAIYCPNVAENLCKKTQTPLYKITY
jgi:Caspase domain